MQVVLVLTQFFYIQNKQSYNYLKNMRSFWATRYCRKKVSEYKMCDIFCLVRNIPHSKKISARDITINARRSSCKLPIILARVYWNLNFLERFLKNTQISNFMKIREFGAELFHAATQTDWQTWLKLIVAFRNFPNAPKI